MKVFLESIPAIFESILSPIVRLTFLSLLVFVAPMPSSAGEPQIYFVDANVEGGADDCSSWDDACFELQRALSLATSGDQIWVADGSYRPDFHVLPQGGGYHSFERGEFFQLLGGVAIYGGFAGGENTLEERAGLFEETILTGDLFENDGSGFDNFWDNSYHVVVGVSGLPGTILDGFTIRGGNADGVFPFDKEGGGMRLTSGSPVIRNCDIRENLAERGGAGIIASGSSPVLDDLYFTNNHVSGLNLPLEQAFGGALFLFNSSAMVSNSTFEFNSVDEPNSGNAYGGAIGIRAGAPTITNSTFEGNSSLRGGAIGAIANATVKISGSTFSRNNAVEGAGTGGALYTYESSPLVANTLFSGNMAASGAGVYVDQGDVGGLTSRFANVIFNYNTASDSGGGLMSLGMIDLEISTAVFNRNRSLAANGRGGGIYKVGGSGVTSNTTLWDNTASDGDQIYDTSSSLAVSHSNIEGGYVGTGNINAEPSFVDVSGKDGILGNGDDDLCFKAGSAGTDNGSNLAVPDDFLDLDGDFETDERLPVEFRGHARFINDPFEADNGIPDPPEYPSVVDMGACEFQAVRFFDPPSMVVDARQPHEVDSTSPLQGISVLAVTAPEAAAPGNWTLCETGDNGLGPNEIESIQFIGNNTYNLHLARPISIGEATSVLYKDIIAGHFISHPGNVDGDGFASPIDILALIDYLNGNDTPPWELYSTDLNQSDALAPADILREIDLLNGAGTFAAWNGTARPIPNCLEGGNGGDPGPIVPRKCGPGAYSVFGVFNMFYQFFFENDGEGDVEGDAQSADPPPVPMPERSEYLGIIGDLLDQACLENPFVLTEKSPYQVLAQCMATHNNNGSGCQ